VRESAEKRIYGRVNFLKKFKYINPYLIIGMTGCLVQKDKNIVFKNAPHVDFAIGPQEISKIPEIINEARKGIKYVGDFKEREYIGESEKGLIENPYQSWLSIMKGCDNYCSYCIVPYVRGHEISKDYRIIEDEFKYLADCGVKDVTLLGQNVNSYGKGLDEDIDFAELMIRLDRLDLISRIRFMTSHPKDFDERIVNAIKNGKNLCDHIHLPFQAGSDRILKMMNRKYSVDDYLKKIDLVRKELPLASLTTDIIVGFPGETEEDFNQTVKLVEKVRFDSAHTFIYSVRSGTKAAEFKDQIPEEVKKERIKRLIDIQNKISIEINRKLEGNTYRILVEGWDKNKTRLQGRTTSNKIVIFKGDSSLVGSFVDVKILEGLHWTLIGEKIDV
jgi:tRNA-2-methylthio-N6-dimethylallyladenosine synthase